MWRRWRRSRRRSPKNRPDEIPKYLTGRWLADNTLFGPACKVRDGIAAWRAAGVSTPVLVPNSLNGNQITALEELFTAFTDSDDDADPVRHLVATGYRLVNWRAVKLGGH